MSHLLCTLNKDLQTVFHYSLVLTCLCKLINRYGHHGAINQLTRIQDNVPVLLSSFQMGDWEISPEKQDRWINIISHRGHQRPQTTLVGFSYSICGRRRILNKCEDILTSSCSFNNLCYVKFLL